MLSLLFTVSKNNKNAEMMDYIKMMDFLIQNLSGPKLKKCLKNILKDISTKIVRTSISNII